MGAAASCTHAPPLLPTTSPPAPACLHARTQARTYERTKKTPPPPHPIACCSTADDFFELGGTSLLAGRINSEVRKRLGIDISGALCAALRRAVHPVLCCAVPRSASPRRPEHRTLPPTQSFILSTSNDHPPPPSPAGLVIFQSRTVASMAATIRSLQLKKRAAEAEPTGSSGSSDSGSDTLGKESTDGSDHVSTRLRSVAAVVGKVRGGCVGWRPGRTGRAWRVVKVHAHACAQEGGPKEARPHACAARPSLPASRAHPPLPCLPPPLPQPLPMWFCTFLQLLGYIVAHLVEFVMFLGPSVGIIAVYAYSPLQIWQVRGAAAAACAGAAGGAELWLCSGSASSSRSHTPTLPPCCPLTQPAFPPPCPPLANRSP